MSLSSHVLCLEQRCDKNKDGKTTTINGKTYHIISSSYLVDGAQNNHFHTLVPRKEEEEGDKSYLDFFFKCWACQKSLIPGKIHYICKSCTHYYHKECVESPSLLHSSDHPKHEIQLLWFPGFHENRCYSCSEYHGKLFYYCSVCDFLIHTYCAIINPTPLTINNRRRHEHTLHYFPRKSTMVCDVCGLEGNIEYIYVCFLCDFIVHKRCIYLPYVVKASRHEHRLAFTPYIPYKEWTHCGVCHTKIIASYGKYSCVKGCNYAIHSKCIMDKDVCDGKELEGEPEEAYENIIMFKEEGDGIIRHLSHQDHQMRLERNIHIESKHCGACMLPFDLDGGNVYQCMQCDFVLHESCVYIPRVKQYMLHIDPLILQIGETTTWFQCFKCYRYSCGFNYVCSNRNCSWKMDTICASISEPYNHHSHPHPLFITCDKLEWKECSICRLNMRQPFDCIKCDFSLCFKCAMLPHKMRYELDEHFLTYLYAEEVYLCGICEEDIEPKRGLYACNECEVTIHTDCLLGKDPYLKPGLSKVVYEVTIHSSPNARPTRPICRECNRRCPYKIVIETSSKGIFCSMKCIDTNMGSWFL